MELTPISISKETSRRMAVMSFVCACMVVAIHCTPTPLLGSWQWWITSLVGANGLCRIAVPWFFVASGFFLVGHVYENRWYAIAVKKRIGSLLVPFVFWALIWLVVRYCVWLGIQKCGYSSGVENPFADGILAALQSAFGLSLHKSSMGVIWYLRMLFVLVLVSPFILRLIRWMGVALPLVALIIYGVYDTIYHNHYFWEYVISIRGIAFFSLGVTMRVYGNQLCWAYVWLVRHVALVGILGTGLLFVNSVARARGYYYLANMSDFLFVLPALVVVWRLVAFVNLPKWCIKNSFALFLIHPLFVLLTMPVLSMFIMRNTLFGSMIQWMIAIFASLVSAMLLKHAQPVVAKLLFGGR